jgi:predicted dehydrogenase
MAKIRLGIIGLGQRGFSLIKTIISTEDADITALCDVYEDRVEKAFNEVKSLSGVEAESYTDHKRLLESSNVDAVFISCAWEGHTEIAIAAMKAGKIVAMEVGGAYTVEECWELVKTYEETKTPFMFMENCCYDKFELQATALVRAGKLGKIVHCHGAYSHDLRDEITGGNNNRHYRLRNYINRNCENYPTHELGPIAKILNINRGNRMLSLVSVSSKAEGLKDYLKARNDIDETLRDVEFKQGDVVSTIIKCAGGETITLTLDTTLPKYYSREFILRGTKGLVNAEAEMIAIEGECNTHEFWENSKNTEKYSEYINEIWRNITKEAIDAGHGGMDYLEFKEFFAAIKAGGEMPIDVYDAAAWMVITALSEQSIATGMPVSIPDFTNGKWLLRKPSDVVSMPNPNK